MTNDSIAGVRDCTVRARAKSTSTSSEGPDEYLVGEEDRKIPPLSGGVAIAAVLDETEGGLKQVFLERLLGKCDTTGRGHCCGVVKT